MRVIKKYINRKLYDTQDGKYITLPQLTELVKQNIEVQVIDNATKGDITKETLSLCLPLLNLPLDEIISIINLRG